MGLFDGIKGIFEKIVPSRNDKIIGEIMPLVEKINALEPEFEKMGDDQLRGLTPRFRERLDSGESLEDLLPEAYAAVRESSRRNLKTGTGVAMRHYDVQLIGGIVLNHGGIAEMRTGEGKTLVATLPAYLNALPGKGVHVVTVNDYLAKRDADWMRPVFGALGMTVGAIQSNMQSQERLEQYGCDVTYGTNNEFGFDYLRDNMKTRPEDQCQKNRAFAIIDEVDSILVDEARTPLIISGPAEKSTDVYYNADRAVRKLIRDKHFEVKEKEQQVILTEEGIEAAEKLVGVDSFYSFENMHWPHHIEQSLKAHHLYRKDVDYVVNEGNVVIVDEFTGRLMDGRRWSDGLHQAVEAREGLKIKDENQTLATITFQNFFRLYDKISGMTGTAITEAEEFREIYGLEVVEIPTNKPVARDDQSDIVYRTTREKWSAVVDRIAVENETGRPLLVGTISIEDSEALSAALTRRGIKHNVLNAKHHAREAEIISEAGQMGRVTIATNMAGRGTDIVLGDGVKEVGGLMVMGSERHESRRIDNQLRGRCGRQGDPGATLFFLSLEDDLMRLFASDRVSAMLKRFGMDEGVDISHPMVSRSIEKAQKKVEARNFEIRKNLLEYDQVMDSQRKAVYQIRDRILISDNLPELISDQFEEVLEEYYAGLLQIEDPDKPVSEMLADHVEQRFGVVIPASELESEEAVEVVSGKWNDEVSDKRDRAGEKDFDRLLHYILLRSLDEKWKDHLHAMDQLRTGVSMRSYAQVDPKLEYKREGFRMFTGMLHQFKEDTSAVISRIRIEKVDESRQQEQLAKTWSGGSEGVTVESAKQQFQSHSQQMDQGVSGSQKTATVETIRNDQPKVGRNDPCPCGSGKKYKKCCGKQ
ncbi:MAG: preprotein translocase subunit SecA [Planctomycetia bacterium TMED53]|nr:MAG: preprotein translocase subunit SecA [Planctomycetia bacterium TMED53]